MEKVLTILEVSRKQDYIFSSKKLRENAARSADIAYVTSSQFFREAAGELYDERRNLVYSGGGHTVLQFDGSEQARAFARQVTEAVLRQYDGLELFVKQTPYDNGRTPGENLKELSAALERKKSVRQARFRRLSFGVERLDGNDFAPMVVTGGQGRRLGPTNGPFPPAGWEFPKEFDDLAGEDNFIAVAHIDGNAMGARVSRIYDRNGGDWTSCCSSLRRFSEGIQKDFEAAFTEMATDVSRCCPKLAPWLPVRPVILAGDDVCFVTAGSLGLECARIFLERLTERTNHEDGKPYAACAGVALVHKRFPFRQAYDLAEQLCSSAKRFGAGLDPTGRVCAMDWHIEFGQMKDSLSELREDYATEDGGRLELRPVAVLVPPESKDAGVRDYAFVKALCRSLQENQDRIARSKVKELRTALKQGEVESRFFLHDKQISDLLYRGFDARYQNPNTRWNEYRRMLQEKAEADKPIFVDAAGEKRCLFFDAIEMMDHFTVLEEVEA